PRLMPILLTSEQQSQRAVCRCLRPMQHRCTRFDEWIDTIEKVPVSRLHVADGPQRDSFGKRKRGRIEIGKSRKRLDRLRGTLAVDGLSAVVIIPWTA